MSYGKGAAIALLALVGVVVLSVGAFFISNEWRRGTANYRGETAQIERTRANASFRIQSYEWFFDQCAAVQTSEDQLDIQERELDEAEGERAGRIRTNLVALENRRAQLINQYNQEAAKERTSGPFRDADLPARLEVSNYDTECAFS